MGDHLIFQGMDQNITGGDARRQITASAGGFDPVNGDRHFMVSLNAGRLGTNFAARELQSVAGLATVNDAVTGKEHLVIADPVGGRVHFWTDKMRYATSYTTAGIKPTGLAKHPLKNGVVFVLDRGDDVAPHPAQAVVGRADRGRHAEPAREPAGGRSVEIGLTAAAPRAPTCCWRPSTRPTTASSSTS